MKNKNLNKTYIRPIKIRFINFSGLKTLYIKEILRFLKIPAQTIIGSIFSSLMFMFVFSIVIGNRFESEDANLYINFLAPGLIIMSSLQNSFSNSSSSMISMKRQGNIHDFTLEEIGMAQARAENKMQAGAKKYMKRQRKINVFILEEIGFGQGKC